MEILYKNHYKNFNPQHKSVFDLLIAVFNIKLSSILFYFKVSHFISADIEVQEKGLFFL